MAAPFLRRYHPSADNPWDRAKAAHLLSRAGFGGTPEEIAQFAAMGVDRAVDALLDYDAVDDVPFAAVDFAELREMYAELLRLRRAGADERTLRGLFQQIQRANARKYQELRAAWVDRMLRTRRPLLEKMVLFWHGFLVSGAPEVRAAEHMALQIDLFRRLATGSFKDLILAISRDPAMLSYLDNNSNRKGKPNENYAREMLELFTMGIGNYTEQDIKEAARAFTGWTFEGNTFVFRRNQHDDGTKTFLGRTGNWDGTDIIDIIFQQPSSARHLPRKLFEFFAYQGPDAAVADELAGIFRRAAWSVQAVLRAIFQSELFYSARAMRAQIKSPVQLVVGTVRTLRGTSGQAARPEMPVPVLLRAMDLMGQSLLLPPHVGGWPAGNGWINTATILVRYNFSNLLLGGAMPGIPGCRPSTSAQGAPSGVEGRPRAALPVDQLVDVSKARTAGDVIDLLVDRLIQAPIAPRRRWALLRAFGTNREDAPVTADGTRLAEQLRSAVHLIMSMPEYQLH